MHAHELRIAGPPLCCLLARIVWSMAKPALVLDIDGLRAELARLQARLIAIDGRGGSGKSTLARRLAEEWADTVVVEMDDFYRPTTERVARPEVHGANYDRERLVR